MQKLLRRLAIACTLLGLSSLASQADASFLGDQLTTGYYFPDAATAYGSATFAPGGTNPSSPVTVVDPGQEATGNIEGVTTLNIDFADSTLQVTLNTVLNNPVWNSDSFNGLIFQSPNSLGIAGVTVDPSTNMAGFDASRVSFTGNEIRVNWQGLGYVDGTVVRLNFAFVPAPSALSLLLPGIMVAGFFARRAAV
jgi:hypothetical protein